MQQPSALLPIDGGPSYASPGIVPAGLPSRDWMPSGAIPATNGPKAIRPQPGAPKDVPDVFRRGQHLLHVDCGRQEEIERSFRGLIVSGLWRVRLER